MHNSKNNKANILKIIMIISVVISLYVCNSNIGNKKEITGLIWEISKDGQTNTILGTMHPMPTGYENISREVINRLNNSNGLAILLDITDADIIGKLHESRQLDKGDRLENHLTADEISKLEKILNSYDREVNIDMIKGLNSKGIYNSIMNLSYLQTGFISSSNETELILRAKEQNMPMVQLLGINNSNKFLADIFSWEKLKVFINNYEYKGGSYREKLAIDIFTAYLQGDLERLLSLESSIHEDYDYNKDVVDLFTSTNNYLAENIDNGFKEIENYLIVIDYRHLIGSKNVLMLLEEKGYEVKRVYN